MSGCGEFQEEILDKFYGEISGPALRQLERHLAGCDACQAEERKMRVFLSGVQEQKESAVNFSIPSIPLSPIKRQGFSWWIRLANIPLPAYQVALILMLVMAGWGAGLWMMVSALDPRSTGDLAVYPSVRMLEGSWRNVPAEEFDFSETDHVY